MALHPLTWILVTMTLAAGWWTLTWFAHNDGGNQPSRLAGFVAVPGSWRTVGWIVYLGGVPLLALALRVVPPTRMGLVSPSSPQDAAAAATLVAAGLVVLLTARWWLNRSLGRSVRWTPVWPTLSQVGWIALGALLLELHWAFFRAGTLTLPYATAGQAVFLAIGLLALEAWSNPWRRAAWAEPDEAIDLAQGAVFALMSALTFWLTGSSVLAVALHIVAMLLLVTAEPRVSEEVTQQAATEVEPTVV